MQNKQTNKKNLSVSFWCNFISNPLDGARVQRMELLPQSKTSATIHVVSFWFWINYSKSKRPKDFINSKVPFIITPHLALVCVVSHMCTHHLNGSINFKYLIFENTCSNINNLSIVFIAFTDGCNPTRNMTVNPNKTHFRFPKVQPLGRALDFI